MPILGRRDRGLDLDLPDVHLGPLRFGSPPSPARRLAEALGELAPRRATLERALAALRDTARDTARSATRARRDAGRELRRTGRRLHLDDGFEGLARRIRRDVPDDALDRLAAGIERRLPGTDRDRYDRAVARGRARTRTGYLGVGALAGLAAGALAVLLLEPGAGAHRRARLAGMARTAVTRVRATLGDVRARVSGRAREVARERGLLPAHGERQPEAGPPAMAGTAGYGTAPGSALGADAPAGTHRPATLAPAFRDRVTDPGSLDREVPRTTEAGEPAGRPWEQQAPGRLPVEAGAASVTGDPEAGGATTAPPEDERGTWHRTL